MKLTDDQVQSFLEAYEKAYGYRPSWDEGYEMAQKALMLYERLANDSPDPEKEDGRKSQEEENGS